MKQEETKLLNGKAPHIAILGLGYVGLPLAKLFSHNYPTIGFDISKRRIAELEQAIDETKELSSLELEQAIASGLTFTSDIERLRQANTYIVAVPTPVDYNNHPDLRPILSATKTIAEVIKSGDIVIYESTVYPGVTEEQCVPLIEELTGLCLNRDFYAGYSPERVNPGDKQRPIETIVKVTSGSNDEVAQWVDRLYRSVLSCETYLAPSIRVAEASKIVENAQRDVNIAFVNELAKLFHEMGIDTHEVLKAAATKWNFMPFSPGLVGGHCIGIDPYYLIEKALVHRFRPRIMLEARTLNDSMGSYIAELLLKGMIKRGLAISNASILIMGFAFKENCPDIRNTKVADLYKALEPYCQKVEIWDPEVSSLRAWEEYGIAVSSEPPSERTYQAVLLAVAHDTFRQVNPRSFLENEAMGVVLDVKAFYPQQVVDIRL